MTAAMRADYTDLAAMAAYADWLLEQEDETQRLRGEALSILVAGGKTGNANNAFDGGYWDDGLLGVNERFSPRCLVASGWFRAMLVPDTKWRGTRQRDRFDPVNCRLWLMDAYARASLRERRAWAKRTLSEATGYQPEGDAT